jgi:DNA repair protein RadA/Sms
MAKAKTRFLCQECGYESSGWLGKCPACGEWNTFVEEMAALRTLGNNSEIKITAPVKIGDVEVDIEERSLTGMKEFDRVLGGGIVKGSLILVGGDPGIGKSTLLLQVCDRLAAHSKILYISGEESVRQIKLRADRLGVRNSGLLMAGEVNYDSIEKLITGTSPELAVVDSIQTVFNDRLSSAPGSVSQVREAASGFMRLAKTLGIIIVVVGHVTKEGAIAGPRVLEHMVDTVLYFEGDRHLSYRILRGVKNRFGSTNEIGIFEMRDEGLVEVGNPSMAMLSGRPENVPGSVVVSSIEGTRPMLVEVQALVCASGFGMPRRMATGVDHNRVTLLMAVLEKRVGLELYNYDAYVNVAGGMKIDEPACDLGITAAVASSFKNAAISADTVLIGEVGLTGEVRAVSHIDKRVIEASRIGFEKCVVPEGNKKALSRDKAAKDIEIIPVGSVSQALDIILSTGPRE